MRFNCDLSDFLPVAKVLAYFVALLLLGTTTFNGHHFGLFLIMMSVVVLIYGLVKIPYIMYKIRKKGLS